ncbi:MAG: hypothetical protein HY211_08225 [Candidatus Omnitrophica bacterium]|nr:hypothetical protein [Candidatus Omnitrophota bacterium]
MRLTKLNDLVRGREIIDGTWVLGKNHEIRYRRRDGEQEVALKGTLIAAEENALVIQAAERSTDDEILSRTLTLQGRWQADPQNRLTFLVERRSDRQDRLTFSGGWEIGESNEIVYRYEQLQLKTRQRAIQTLSFRGAWDIDDAHQLTYVLDRGSDSAFRFRGTFQTPTVLAKEGAIRYQLGIELEGRRHLQTITLFGKWKLSRDLSLDFEIPYADGSARAITLGATYRINAEDSIQAQLTARNGEPLGMELLFTRDFLKGQGEAFLRLRNSLEEKAVEGGLRFRW